MTDYYLKDKKWKESGNTNIKKESDSTFILTYLDREGYTEKRHFCKTDSGFLIKDYKGDILVQEGKSRLLFPLIKYGYWRHFSPSTGQIANECYYADNQFVTNKWWLNNGEFLTDVSVNCDKNAEFEGGDIALLKFVSEHLEYPIQARNNGISGRVIVSFVVMTDGSIKGIRILRGVDPLLDAEAIRVIKSLPPDKWKPAEIEGRKVNFPMMIPIGFTLN
jgi:TonB family protein